MLEYFREGPIIPDNKDHQLALLSTWIWEVGEFGNTMRKADMEMLKWFLTASTIKERGAYNKHNTQGATMCSFIATANNQLGFFNDPTGTSRFMTVNLTGINWQGYTRDIDQDQLWAQAMDLYLNGEQWDLSDSERETASEINAEYEMVDLVGETILKLYAIEPWNKVAWCSSLEIMDELKSTGGLKAGIEIDMRKMASALTKLGLEKPAPRKVQGVSMRGYYGIRKLP